MQVPRRGVRRRARDLTSHEAFDEDFEFGRERRARTCKLHLELSDSHTYPFVNLNVFFCR